MAHIIGMWGINPKIGKNCILSDSTVIRGDVEIGDDCSIGENTEILGIHGKVVIENGVRISRNTKISCMVNIPVFIGENVVVGDTTEIESSQLEKNVVIGSNCKIRFANILENSEIPDHFQITMGIWGGKPAALQNVVNPHISFDKLGAVSEIDKNNIDWKK